MAWHKYLATVLGQRVPEQVLTQVTLPRSLSGVWGYEPPMRSAVWPLLALALAGCPKAPQDNHPLRIAAASDLALVLEGLRLPFEVETHQKVELILGSSGKLSSQLVEGAPFDLFFSASQDFTDEPIRSGACEAASRARYAEGRLVIDAQREPIQRIEDLKDARFKRIAIANPEHAPYGRAAKEALIRAGIWDAVEPRIVYGDTVQQTLQLSRSGNVEAALVARSLAKDSLAVDPALHASLIQFLVICTRGQNVDGARAFARLILGERGQQALLAGGFELPAKELR